MAWPPLGQRRPGQSHSQQGQRNGQLQVLDDGSNTGRRGSLARLRSAGRRSTGRGRLEPVNEVAARDNLPGAASGPNSTWAALPLAAAPQLEDRPGAQQRGDPGQQALQDNQVMMEMWLKIVHHALVAENIVKRRRPECGGGPGWFRARRGLVVCTSGVALSTCRRPACG